MNRAYLTISCLLKKLYMRTTTSAVREVVCRNNGTDTKLKQLAI
ncbi:uncharacterized protein METZ01_LOCUS228504 [marine metagenome]|uniref:Uncharacterized protein n=1 Tax=marine metagenome TaxID=408172 RepID=A0A382GKJ2_9ZZZZ